MRRDALAATLLPQRRSGPMPWLIAVTMFVTVLAGAAGLALGNVARTLAGADSASVQLLAANPQVRAAEEKRVLALLATAPEVTAVRRVPDAEVRRLVEPWLGGAQAAAEIPLPSLIEFDMLSGSDVAALQLRIERAVPGARVAADAAWLAPLADLIASLRWLALGMIGLSAGATIGTVILAARAALDGHRSEVEVLHLIGATDRQVAQLFTRRVALDASWGAATGYGAALLVYWLVARRLDALAADLLSPGDWPVLHWLFLAFLPLLGVLLAMLVARIVILRALGRLL